MLIVLDAIDSTLSLVLGDKLTELLLGWIYNILDPD